MFCSTRRPWPEIRSRTAAHALLAVLGLSAADALAAQEVGPAEGALVIVGGAMRDTAIVRTFIDLAGGVDAPIVVVPTAGGGEYDPYYRGLAKFRDLGASDLTVLHTYDPEEADTEAFVEPLREARGVWFDGGRQWRLVDAYGGTRTEEAFRGVLERGGVIGGTSAGASIQASFLARGDTATNTIMMGSHQRGFGYLRNAAIDQHLLMRNRQFDLIEIVSEHPELLGIGIDENTAIVVQGDRFRVMGEGYVAIYDHGSMLDSGGLFYFLAPGDEFDLREREAARPGRRMVPLGRVEERPWPGRGR